MTQGTPFDELAKKRYLISITRGRPPRTAAEDMGFAWKTVQKHIKADLEFAQEFESALVLVNESVEEALLDQARDGNLGAIKEWLHNRQPDRWTDSRVIDHRISGAGGGPLEVAAGGVLALRRILTDPELRAGGMAMIQAIPAVALETGDDSEIVDAEIVVDDD